VECDRADQVTEAVAARATVIMLDNMTPDQIAHCVGLVRQSATDILVEVSGGVTLETVPAYAATGVDLISVGALTHSAPVLDLAFDLAPGPVGSER
jgi:nicotinate-nucleotide pyrophosphorylase (carboxylating)